MGGKVVRLQKGQASKVKVYSDDPVRTAQSWSGESIDGLHVVDLDAAFGDGSNIELILRLIRSVRTPVQVGGGIRNETIARRLIENGADRVVIGTAAMADELALERISGVIGKSRIVVALDYASDRVLTRGWREVTEITLDGALRSLMNQEFRHFLLTCADRDGMMSGPDVDTIRSVCRQYKEAKILASGGVRSANDVRALRDAGAYAIIVGKALLEETLQIPDALKEAAG